MSPQGTKPSREALALIGIPGLGAIAFYVGATILGGVLDGHYSQLWNTISDLTATGAPNWSSWHRFTLPTACCCSCSPLESIAPQAAVAGSGSRSFSLRLALSSPSVRSPLSVKTSAVRFIADAMIAALL